jgi:hypothetical protein
MRRQYSNVAVASFSISAIHLAVLEVTITSGCIGLFAQASDSHCLRIWPYHAHYASWHHLFYRNHDFDLSMEY